MMHELSSIQQLVESLAPWVIVVGLPFLFRKSPAWRTRIEGRIERIEKDVKKIEGRIEKF